MDIIKFRPPRAAPALALAVLALLACLLVASTWRVFGNAWDEPEHLAAGMALLERGQYLYDNQHPPLARLAAALGPHLAGARLPEKPSGIGEEAGRQILYHSTASYDTLLTLARVGMLPFLLVLIISLWRWVRYSHGDATAWVALAFLLTTPAILGHAGFVALDVPVTALCTLSLYLLMRWVEFPTLRRGAALGLATGLAISTKLSAIPFLGVAGIALLLVNLALPRGKHSSAAPRGSLGAYAGSGALAGLLVLVTIIAAYGPNLIYLTTPELRPNRALDMLAGSSGALHDAAYRLAAQWRVPLGVQEVPINIMDVNWHNTHGHMGFLLGQTSLMGWWYFYPVALAVKTPLPLLLLGLAGLAGLAVRGWRTRRLEDLAPPLFFVTILVFCCLYSHINIGVRHVLVLYPLLAIGAATACVALWRRAGSRLLRGAIVAVLLWQAGTMAFAYPDYLAYFNVLAGEHPERILVDSDLDWGQDLRRLAHELERRHVPELYLAYRGTADLSREGLPPFHMLRPGQQVTGWVAVDMLSMKEGRDGYAWLDESLRVQRVGKSIDLYFIPPR